MKNHESDGILATNPLGEKPCKKKKPGNDLKISAQNAAAQTSFTTTTPERPSAEAAASFLANKRWTKVPSGGLSPKRRKNPEAELEFPHPTPSTTKDYPLP